MILPALYARYSSDRQRSASIDDQVREGCALATRHGWPKPEIYTDAEISGERKDRPGYTALLRAARAGEFNVLLLWDLKRLSRAADLPHLLENLRYWGVRVVTCDGFDSDQEGADIRGWIDGLMGKRYLRELAKNTHRGLKGRALAGASAGGLPYGYRKTEVGQRAIDDAEAAVVRRIFNDYLDGLSPRRIADNLNRERIKSPRGSTWAVSAVYGDAKRGIGILGNPIYIGRQVWNRSQWIKDPETGLRTRKERPESEWIVTEHPELAIIDPVTWQAAQKRLASRRQRNPGKARPGTPMRYLLSGVLRCGECGGPFVMLDRKYGCATHKDRGSSVCASDIRLPQKLAESVLLSGVKEQLLSDAAYQQFLRLVTAALKDAGPDTDRLHRELRQAEQERDNIMNAIRAGIITPTTKRELEAAEARAQQIRAELTRAKTSQPVTMVPRIRQEWQRIVATLEDYARNIPAAREALRELLGENVIVRRNENGEPVAEFAASPALQIAMVAGAGFEPATFGL